VICYDECGPLELRPLHGPAWAPAGHPLRLRATYRRLQGTEQLLAFYDVHGDCLAGQVRKRKTHRDVVAAFRRLRACYPANVRLYIVMDNLNTHRHPAVRQFLHAQNMEAVFTPTYASWLNAIEAHFAPLKKFTLQVTDDRDHRCRRRRIARYLTWRNRRASATHCPLAKYARIKLEGH
jgi:transposase